MTKHSVDMKVGKEGQKADINIADGQNSKNI